MKFKPQISRRGKHFFAEIALARGPRQMAVTGSGSFGELFGYAWMAILDRGERRLRLFQLQVAGAPWAIGTDPAGAEWVEVSVPALPHDTKELRHLAVAFDQAARHVVAYERAGEVWVRQWDPGSGQYVMRGPWPGVDPVLVMDAEAGYYIPDSDVLLYHLGVDRRTIILRAQRELYSVANTIEILPEDAFLDQAVSLPYQIELLGSFSSDPSAAGMVVRTDLYPARSDDTLGSPSFSAPTSGLYWPVVVVRDLGSDLVGGASVSAPPSGIYTPIVVTEDLGIELLAAPQISAPGTGNLHPVVIVKDAGQDAVGSAQVDAPSGGTYALVVVIQDLTQNPYSVDQTGAAQLAAPTGGSYDVA